MLVVRTLPSVSRHYARGLLKTVEFLTGTGPQVPALASGVGEARDLEERLTMIMKERPQRSLSRTQKSLLAFAAAGLLLIYPTWSDRAVTQAAATDVDREMDNLAPFSNV